ncbi:MAG: UDP-2,3-diacylglucosamine diphosphatase [Campylobacterota bacterium]|nr:UDP-2,3-diacylglucosamine diphosphatase [Campylobacterota bacterium]
MNIQRLTHIKEGAIFIADSHYPHHGEEIITLLSNLPANTPQLFLMGDIFDILFDHARYLLEYNQKLITLINKLSETIDIFYFEGNHDFNLQTVFPKVKLYSFNQQPQFFKFNNQSVALAHGDRFGMSKRYYYYTSLIRSRKLMQYLPFKQKLMDKQIRHLKSKKICNKFVGFEKRMETIVLLYEKHYRDYEDFKIIEGHYHQGRQHQNYISLPSLVCHKKVGVIEDNKLIFKALKDMI